MYFPFSNETKPQHKNTYKKTAMQNTFGFWSPPFHTHTNISFSKQRKRCVQIDHCTFTIKYPAHHHHPSWHEKTPLFFSVCTVQRSFVFRVWVFCILCMCQWGNHTHSTDDEHKAINFFLRQTPWNEQGFNSV